MSSTLFTQSLYIEALLRLFLAAFLGGLLGFERTHTGRAAGLRTYTIVCSTSALIMMTNLYLFDLTGKTDPVRLGAQVISGIGFLGAGTILVTGKNRQHIKGLTTAAGLWASGAIGLACGCGFYIPATAATLFIFFAMYVLKRVERHISVRERSLALYMELDSLNSMSGITDYFHSVSITIDNVRMSRPYLNNAQSAATYVILLPKGQKQLDIIETLVQNEHVIYIEETY